MLSGLVEKGKTVKRRGASVWFSLIRELEGAQIELATKGEGMSGKFLINLQHGQDDLEKATVAMMVASTAVAMDGETVVMLTCAAAHLAVRGVVDPLAVPGYPTLADLVTEFIDGGGQFWICPVSARTRGIQAEDLIEGAEIVGAGRMIGFVEAGARLLM